MSLTKTETLIISALILTSILEAVILGFQVFRDSKKTQLVYDQISSVAKLTSKEPIKKGVYFALEEDKNKLNLLRTDLKSISELPGVGKRLAANIYKFIHTEREQPLSSLRDLLLVRGMTEEQLKNLEPYVTFHGGHAGRAGWGEKLNINFASEEDFDDLPGISPKIAKSAVEYRNSRGNFTYCEELLEVKGMTRSIYKKIKNLITIR